MSKHLRMEEKIKSFDRNIEHLMNDATVAPPFGMWNRISAELDGAAEVLPVAAKAPVSPASQRVFYTVIAATALIGTSILTAMWVNHNAEHKTLQQQPLTYVPSTNNETSESVVHPNVVTNLYEKPVSYKAKHIAKAAEQTVSPVMTEEPVFKQRVEATTEVAVPSIAANSTDIATEAYYFPPVDVNSQENRKDMTIASEKQALTAEEKPIEKKTKSVSSSSNDKRISIKKRKRGGFTYGSLNRLRKQRSKY